MCSSDLMSMVRWTGIFRDDKSGLKQATPAAILQHLLEQKWVLEENDKDMIVMQHIFDYKLNGVSKCLRSSLVVLGEDRIHTAMAKTVGLPMAITATLLLECKITGISGVHIPVLPEIYEPVLKELHQQGVVFQESNQG